MVHMYFHYDNKRPGLGTVACVLGSRIASSQILKKFGVREFHSQPENSRKSPFPNLFSSMKLSSVQLTDFLRNSENVHKLLLQYASQHQGPFVPIAFNPFETVLLVNDAEVSKQILHGMNNAFKNRTSFPIIDYTYHR